LSTLDVAQSEMTVEEVQAQVERLGPWFHNMELRGVRTAPNHFLGDYPAMKYRNFAHAIPADLSGKTVLDVGCNAGFYSMEMKRRGAARVVGIDSEDLYLEQARFATAVKGMRDIEFHKMDVYDVAALGERFDLVIFMGVLYHLRHPLLALDLLREHVVGDLMLFQSMLRGSAEVDAVDEDYAFQVEEHFDRPGYPKMHFIEHRYAQDPTNWWAPNRACAEAMLRSSGFEIVQQAEDEVFLCRGAEITDGMARAVYPKRG
jgi:tRNA (mo5U34)-methyltransferase